MPASASARELPSQRAEGFLLRRAPRESADCTPSNAHAIVQEAANQAGWRSGARKRPPAPRGRRRPSPRCAYPWLHMHRRRGKNAPDLVGWLPAPLGGREMLVNARCQEDEATTVSALRRADPGKIILRRHAGYGGTVQVYAILQCLRCRRLTGTSCGWFRTFSKDSIRVLRPWSNGRNHASATQFASAKSSIRGAPKQRY
jgi:hypothetical protein